MKRGIAFFVILLSIILIWYKSREKYTDSDFEKLLAPIVNRNTRTTQFDEKSLIHYLSNAIFNELNDDRANELSNVNSIIDLINIGRSSTVDHYANIDELNTMYDTAYSSGESSLSIRDRLILRMIAFIGLAIKPPFPITYTTEGIPDWTSTIVSDSGKTTKEMLLFGATLLVKLHRTDATSIETAFNPEFYDYLNSMIPDKFSPKFDRTNPQAFLQALQSTTPDEKTTWVWKAVSIGPAYITWLAENKWKLDVNWNPT